MSEKKKKVGFGGLSGNGVSPLAQIMKLKGYDVYGCDRSFDQGRDEHNKKALKSVGIKIGTEEGEWLKKDFEALYVSTALEDTVPLIKKAKELGITMKFRPDLLAEIFHQYTYNIAIGGTSGKTTITAMAGYVLETLKQLPVVVNGGLLKNYEDRKGLPNFIYNEGNICVIEADESNGSILKYHPYMGVISSVSKDHKSLEDIIAIFNEFANKCQQGLIINEDCRLAAEIKHPRKQTITYSIKNPKADFYAGNIEPLPDGTKYSFYGKSYKLNLIGAFNVSNAMAAIAVCAQLGIDKHDAAKALEGFLGTKRRLEVMGVNKGIAVFNDFAHNPEKVAGSLSALKAYEGRLIVMFQPHGFDPMKLTGREIMESFAKWMAKEDVLVMPEIYFVGGTADKDISSKILVDYASSIGVNALLIEKREDVKKFLLDNAKEGDRIVIMGARDNSLSDFAKEVLEDL